MQSYVRKREQVKAIQYTLNNKRIVENFLFTFARNKVHFDAVGSLTINTSSGKKHIRFEDYIVEDSRGEIHIVPDIDFYKFYQKG